MTQFTDQGKFHAGDTVIPNHRAPIWLMVGLRRNRKRTIVAVRYCETLKCSFYMLGSKPGHPHNIGGYEFRSYQLTLVTPRPVGRPRLRRVYRPTVTPTAGPALVRRPGMVVAPLAM